MKRHIILILSACLVHVSVSWGGDDIKYPVSAIPEALKKDVNVVIREDQTVYKLISPSRMTYQVLIAATIFNSKGNSFAEEALSYDKLSKILSFKGSVYDSNGKLIKKLKNADIKDQSSYDGFSLFSDNRIKSADLSQSTYPYTVEFEYEMEHKSLLYLDGSVIVSNEKISVQHSSYELIYPASIRPRYKTYNIEGTPQVKKYPDGMESTSWEFKDVLPIKFEPLSLHQNILQEIKVSPNQFELEGYAGNLKTWEEFGKWQAQVNQGRDILPEVTKQKIRSMTKDLKTPEEKIKVLYEYLQSKTRYVSIQLGIGGLQPFDAATVDQTGYGDCKALSNYMVAMLKEIGIKSYYTKIMAGENAPEVDGSFPSPQSNHIIVCVPNASDTLWLECTSQTNPFGYLGFFTGDRKGLIVTDEGGKLVHTTRYPANKNIQARTAEVIVSLNGDATAHVRTTYSGLQYENGDLNFYLNNQYDDQKKWLQRNTDIPSFDIASFSMKDKKGKIPVAVVNVDLVLKRLATPSAKRFFLTANLMNRSTYIPEKVEARKTNVVVRSSFVDFDTIRYHLPEGIYPEFMPKPVTIKSRFGEYDANYTLDQNDLIYIRRFKMDKGTFPPESYTELIDFYKSLNKADNTKLVFLSKT
jgi:hypothetical protein